MPPSFSRRVGAIFLPDLWCELVAGATDPQGIPLAVVETETLGNTRRGENETAEKDDADELVAQAEHVKELSAVNDAARRFGVRAGQTVAEARALVASL